jgi:hypothetical protein
MTDFKAIFADILGSITGAGKSQQLILTPPEEVPVAHVAVVPANMQRIDLTDAMDKINTKLQPWRRTGTAHMQDLASLIAWANRNKGATSALFANVSDKPSLTCIADYHAEGAPVIDHITRDTKASLCSHRAHYAFPLSREWQLWNAISGKGLGKADLGEFVEANAKDMLTPSHALTNGISDKMEPWERDMHLVAQQVRGRFGLPDTLINLSRRFEVTESNNISTTRNPDTGEATFNFINPHQQPDGSPISIPNLFLVALPVFDNGAVYRLPVRFRYIKSGAEVKFFLTLHNPDVYLRDAIQIALDDAEKATGLPLFLGSPEAA